MKIVFLLSKIKRTIFSIKLSIVFLILINLFFFSLKSQTFENTTLCKRAYENIIALKLDSGKYYLEQEKKKNPSNTYIVYLYNYIDFLKVFTSGSMAYFEKNAKENFASRIEDVKSTKNENSPYFLFIQAEIYLHSAILSVQNKDYLTSIFHLRKALKKLEENNRKFPEFKANKKSLGLLYSILGSVPDNLKTGLSIIGLNGDIKKGMKMLKTLSEDSTFEYQHETITIYAFMLFHLNNEKEKAWNIIKNNNFFNSNNLMDKYTIGHIGVYGLHNDKAIEELVKIQKDKKFVEFPILNYLLALGKTYRLDKDANVYFKKFISTYEGADYIKSSYQKMAWNELLKDEYDSYYKYIGLIKQNGRAIIDADKQAEKEPDLLTPPDAILLKARLLSDGNYTNKALELLKRHSIEDFVMPKERVAYQYRLGRIYQKQKKNELAISYYLNILKLDNKVDAYFAANACYLIGNIYEKNKEISKALKYYEKCLTMNGYEYDNSIKQKAKAGVNRLKKSFF